MNRYDKFDLESAIAVMFNTEEDLGLILYRLNDSPNECLSNNEISAMISGVMEAHKSRCIKLYDMFEDMIEIGAVTQENEPPILTGKPNF